MTRPRLAAAVLLLLAALVQFGITVPAREKLAAAQAEFGRLRLERQRARAQRAELVRRQAAAVRAAGVLAVEGTDAGDAVNGLRRFAVETLKGHGVRQVRLDVGAGRPPVAATLRLSAGGSFGEVMRLCQGLLRPGSGLILERVRLSGGGPVVALEVEGMRLAP